MGRGGGGGGKGGGQTKKPSVGGLWISSGTTHYFRIMMICLFLPGKK